MVLDEGDRMLDMGFLPAIRQILSLLPVKRQTMLFSANVGEHRATRPFDNQRSEAHRSKSSWSCRDYGRQIAYPVAQESKTALLLELLEKERQPFERVLVFTRTRRGAERLSHILKARDHAVACIHSDRTQPQRLAALRAFSDGHARVMVATDIASRGLDIDSVSHVINYDVPAAPEDYVHRIGRTGRAGNQGKAITIVAPVDESSLRAIEKLTGQAVKRIVQKSFAETKSETPAATPAKSFARLTPARNSVRSFRPRRAARA